MSSFTQTFDKSLTLSLTKIINSILTPVLVVTLISAPLQAASPSPHSIGTGEGSRTVAQTVAHSSSRESDQQEALSRYQYIPARARRLRLAVLANLPSGSGAWRQRSQGRARHQNCLLEIRQVRNGDSGR
jgi:hypothetical protein